MTKKCSKRNSSEGNTKPPSPAKHWCFTFNNYKDLPSFVDFCSTCSKIDSYIFQEETGESGTPHLQGYLKFEPKQRPMTIFKLYPTIHWEKCRSPADAIKYCTKSDTRTGNIYNKKIPIPKPLKLIKNLYEWQTKIIDIIKTEPDDRTIHWIWETKGNRGKSALGIGIFLL